MNPRVAKERDCSATTKVCDRLEEAPLFDVGR